MYNFINDTMERQIKDLQELVRIPSVSRGKPKPNAPLGEEVRRALDFALDLARELGFPRVWELDGYCGIVEFGEGEECLGIMAHLDVVPEGDGWSYPPYAAQIHDGRMYGRGVVDDKGAAISALYAMAAVMNSGKMMKRRVRLILGCDEEAGWSCMDRYKQYEQEPTLAFTPDAEYPVVNSEMGIYQTTYTKSCNTHISCQIGTASNVVPGEARMCFRVQPKEVEMPDGFTMDIVYNTLRVHGRGGHASMPDLAHNALQGILFAAKAQYLDDEDRKLIEDLIELYAFDMHGQSLGIDVTDESGRTTFVPSMLTISNGTVTIKSDCRYPFSLKHPDLQARIDRKMAAKGFARTAQKNTPCHFIPQDSELVKTLMEIFNRKVGVELEPLKIGGGTYARAFTNAVAFGTVPYNEESPCHMPDESSALSDIRFNTEIMAEAIEKLACN
ncbi:MAG: Sapep family Mn(2+)-dependent dipeptidase [Eubacteriales bacterium]|nr:Sapep family Mn(2+)-dependent dipeptidase [Eubacteriales bacterium]